MPDIDTYMTDFDEFSSCEFTTDGKSELQSYLEEPKLPRMDDFDVLEYWKPLQGRYPIVSQWLGIFWPSQYLPLLLNQFSVLEDELLMHIGVH
ncbi:hypothetical protein L6452_09718 [Arctium lappa]|uniref:Uncharacterized protein n=1 Tax=Arctium lappa TaxID=4217 RepID=A0ACB9DLG2_ARCLA|nr:hypothetical protein L6452_09718 [Arctium lappa]